MVFYHFIDNLVSLLFNTTIPTSFNLLNEMFFTLVTSVFGSSEPLHLLRLMVCQHYPYIESLYTDSLMTLIMYTDGVRNADMLAQLP